MGREEVPTVTPGGVCLGESGGRKSRTVAVAVGEGQWGLKAKTLNLGSDMKDGEERMDAGEILTPAGRSDSLDVGDEGERKDLKVTPVFAVLESGELFPTTETGQAADFAGWETGFVSGVLGGGAGERPGSLWT